MIETVLLSVKDPKKQCDFYQQILGMQKWGGNRVGYSPCEASIEFLPAREAYLPNQDNTYWKIALAVPNIELAYDQLRQNDIEVGIPKQFQDIGYLAHFQDPEGFTIELIEHHFKGDRPDAEYDRDLLGGGAHLNLITLRTRDIAPDHQMLTNMGMKPLSIQPVEDFGFTLYFYAITSEHPPSEDLYSIENRTWVYRRPYTVLEIQHVDTLSDTTRPAQGVAGYCGTVINSKSDLGDNQLRIHTSHPITRN